MVRSQNTLDPEQGGDGKTLSRYMTPREVADLLRIPLDTLRYWAWSGAQPEGFPSPIKVGRLNRFQRAAIEKWLEEAESGDRS